MTIGRNVLLCVAMICFGSIASSGQSAPAAFVQKFCDWYVPLALKDGSRPAWIMALSEKPAQFDRELATALKVDAAAQARSPGEITGLDFDPFLASQDPDRKYIAGGATRGLDAYWVPIYSARSEGKHSKPDAMIGLKPDHGNWTIFNVRYSRGPDLLTLLKSYRPHH
jgi:hypothetical protein